MNLLQLTLLNQPRETDGSCVGFVVVSVGDIAYILWQSIGYLLFVGSAIPRNLFFDSDGIDFCPDAFAFPEPEISDADNLKDPDLRHRATAVDRFLPDEIVRVIGVSQHAEYAVDLLQDLTARLCVLLVVNRKGLEHTNGMLRILLHLQQRKTWSFQTQVSRKHSIVLRESLRLYLWHGITSF